MTIIFMLLDFEQPSNLTHSMMFNRDQEHAVRNGTLGVSEFMNLFPTRK